MDRYEQRLVAAAEAIVGFLNAFQLTRESKYLDAVWNSWKFTEQNICDKQNGEWFWGVSKAGDPEFNESKSKSMERPISQSRACFEVMARNKA